MRLHGSKIDPSRYYFFRDILDLYPMQNVSMPDFDLNVDDRGDDWHQSDDTNRFVEDGILTIRGVRISRQYAIIVHVFHDPENRTIADDDG